MDPASCLLDRRLLPQGLDPPKPFQKFILEALLLLHTMVLNIPSIKSNKPSLPTPYI